jgi:hypothetical protein
MVSTRQRDPPRDVRVFARSRPVAGLAIMVFLIVQVGSDEALTAFAYDRVPFLRLIAARIAGEAVNVMTAVAPVGGDAIKVSPEPGVTTI